MNYILIFQHWNSKKYHVFKLTQTFESDSIKVLSYVIPQILCVASFQGTFPAWKSYIMQQNFIILYFFQFNFSLSFLYGFFLVLSSVFILLNCYTHVLFFLFLIARDSVVVLGFTLMVVKWKSLHFIVCSQFQYNDL